MKVEKKTIRCDICGKDFKPTDIVLGALVRDTVADMIRKDFPGWSSESHICREDLSNYRTDYVHTLLETEKGELTELEKEVIDSLNKNEIIASDVDSEFEQIWTFGEKLADHIASFGGSWSFLILFALFLILWIGINSFVLFWRPVDPYPFILLNLLLSCLAAIQAPIIMMSQNRQETKDRKRAQHDYQVNLKAELEIRYLHEKIDHLLSKQWERLVQIQEVQLELLSELSRAR